MNLLNLFSRKKEEKRDCTCNGVNYVNPNLNTNVLNFSTCTNCNAMNLSAVFRATELISDSCAILPIDIIDSKNKLVLNGNLSLLFRSHYKLMKLLIQSVILKGNGFAYIERALDGSPVKLRFLQNADVQIHYNKLKPDLFYTCSFISSKRIEPKDMIHLVKNSWDGVNGISLLSFANKTLGIACATEDSASGYFSNGGHLTGILCADGHTTAEQRQDAKSAFISNLKAGDISVLPQEFKYQSVQMNVEDAQLLESRQYNIQDIARFFGISPVLLGDLSNSGYSSIEDAQQQFLVQTLQPYISLIEDEMNLKLGTDNERISLNENYILRTNKSEQASYFNTLVSSGILSANEIREELGYERVNGLDEHIIPFTKIQDNNINQKTQTNE